MRIFNSPLRDFSTPLSPSYEEGVLTPVPKPYAPTIGARDVAGYAIASPEFWYRQRSLCPYGAGDDFLRNRIAIILRLIGGFCAVLHRLPAGLALCSKLSSRLCSKLSSRLCSKLSSRRFTPHKKSQLCCVKNKGEGSDAPPTLERSGSERRVGAVTSLAPMVGA